jgi:hypothetical protein
MLTEEPGAEMTWCDDCVWVQQSSLLMEHQVVAVPNINKQHELDLYNEKSGSMLDFN